LPDLKLIARNIHNARMHCYPKLPTSRKEVHESLSLLDKKTNEGKLFLYHNDTLNEIIIFSCNTNIAYLKQLDFVYNADMVFLTIVINITRNYTRFMELKIEYIFY